MAWLFLLFAIAMGFIWKGMRLPALITIGITLAFCLLVFYLHMTATLKIFL